MHFKELWLENLTDDGWLVSEPIVPPGPFKPEMFKTAICESLPPGTIVLLSDRDLLPGEKPIDRVLGVWRNIDDLDAQ